uniref:Potassium two pore domain channel subfamily K member 16 n=1 Tax=Buteo japonicus TaxID=224669 RepID=A0A8C0B323_9AVES
AMVFQLLEKQAETHFQLEKLKFLQNYTCLDRQALEQFVQVLMEAWEKGINPEGNSTNPSNWDFSNSFFTGTVVTTIGCCNLAPSTVAGQMFCVFYALFGVPLNLAFLNQLGKGLNAHLITLERWVCHLPFIFQVVQTLSVAIFLTTGTLIFLVFPPLVFSYVEGWSYGEGFYFTFINLSTIGFGDYVVGTNPNKHYTPVYRSLTVIWIVFGLAWLALVFNVGADLMEKFPQLKWHKPDLSLAEGPATKLEDEPKQSSTRGKTSVPRFIFTPLTQQRQLPLK